MKAYIYGAVGIAFFLAVIGAFFYGSSIGKAKCEVAHARQAEKDRAAREKEIAAAQAQEADAAEADVQRETIVREVYREIPKIIDRPVYRSDCADADGLRLIDRAISAANGRGEARSGPSGDAGGVQPTSGD